MKWFGSWKRWGVVMLIGVALALTPDWVAPWVVFYVMFMASLFINPLCLRVRE